MSGRASRSSFVFLTVFHLVQAAPPTPRPRLWWGRPSRDDVTRQLRHSAMCAISQSHRVLGSSQNRSCGVHHIFPLSNSPMPCLAHLQLRHLNHFPVRRPYRDVRLVDVELQLDSPTRKQSKLSRQREPDAQSRDFYPTRSPQCCPSDIR